MKKINVFINFINEKVAKHIDFRRLNNSKFYNYFDDVFEILNIFYKNHNRVRNARRQFVNFHMKFDQFFIFFYSKFFYLICQFTNYSKKIKIDCFEEKIILFFKNVLIIYVQKWQTLTNLKQHFQSINTRLSNIRFEIVLRDSRNRLINKKIIIVIFNLSNRFQIVIRIVSFVERKIIKNI